MKILILLIGSFGLSFTSSELIGALFIIIAGCFALSATLLSLNSKETYVYKEPKKAVTDRFLIQVILSFLTYHFGRAKGTQSLVRS